MGETITIAKDAIESAMYYHLLMGAWFGYVIGKIITEWRLIK